MQKPGAGPGLFVESQKQCATAYPAGWDVVGRRAREVMPAAMSALDRISTVAKAEFIGGLSFGGAIMHGILPQRNRSWTHPQRSIACAVAGLPSFGAGLMPSSRVSRG